MSQHCGIADTNQTWGELDVGQAAAGTEAVSGQLSTSKAGVSSLYHLKSQLDTPEKNIFKAFILCRQPATLNIKTGILLHLLSNGVPGKANAHVIGQQLKKKKKSNYSIWN